jgi:hypothetical protein
MTRTELEQVGRGWLAQRPNREGLLDILDNLHRESVMEDSMFARWLRLEFIPELRYSVQMWVVDVER